MSARSLSSPPVSVIKDGKASYGGNQRLFGDSTMRGYGCGVIAAADLLYYLAMKNPGYATPYTGIPEGNSLSFEKYERMCSRLRSSFMPVIPRFGKTGPMLAAGLNAYFSRYNIPLRAKWCIAHEKLFERIEEMLEKDLPVIFSVGANFPIFWGKHKVNLYTRSESGAMRPVSAARAHFMTVTAIDDEFLTLSSWGNKYYMSRREYLDYVKAHGSSITSNIMYLTKQ